MKPILTLLIGALIGWLVGFLYKKNGLGILGNVLIGIPGAYIGYWSFRKIGVDPGTGLISGMIRGAIGATVILLIFNLFFKRR